MEECDFVWGRSDDLAEQRQVGANWAKGDGEKKWFQAERTCARALGREETLHILHPIPGT